MNPERKNSNLIVRKIPLTGILSFVALYFYAATLYPGGSQADLNSVGFDWANNYWCNLMNQTAMNGLINPARPFAIAAMLILCFSLLVFFIQFATVYAKSKFWKPIIKVGGLFSMIFASLIFTQYHDLMTILSSATGLFVVTGIIWEIYKSDMVFYKVSGAFCLLLLGLNNYIYYTQYYLEALPILQKITFLIVLVWILGLNFELGKLRRTV